MVEAVGPKAKGVKPGQKRIVYPWIGYGKCAVLQAGQDNYCVSGIRFLGVSRPGAYSTHLLVPIPVSGGCRGHRRRVRRDAGLLGPHRV